MHNINSLMAVGNKMDIGSYVIGFCIQEAEQKWHYKIQINIIKIKMVNNYHCEKSWMKCNNELSIKNLIVYSWLYYIFYLYFFKLIFNLKHLIYLFNFEHFGFPQDANTSEK